MKKNYGCGTLILVLVVAGFIGTIVNSHQEEEVKADAAKVYAAMSPEQRRVEDSLANARAEAKAKHDAAEILMGNGIAALQEGMKDPDSFKLIHASVGPNGDGACITYRSKNSFGAYTGNQDAVVTPAGRILTEELDGNAFVTSWNRVCVMHAQKKPPTPEEVQAKAELAKRQAAQRAIQKAKDDSIFSFEHPNHGPYWADENSDTKEFFEASCSVANTGIDALRHHAKVRWFPTREVAERDGYILTVCSSEAPQ